MPAPGRDQDRGRAGRGRPRAASLTATEQCAVEPLGEDAGELRRHVLDDQDRRDRRRRARAGPGSSACGPPVEIPITMHGARGPSPTGRRGRRGPRGEARRPRRGRRRGRGRADAGSARRRGPWRPAGRAERLQLGELVPLGLGQEVDGAELQRLEGHVGPFLGQRADHDDRGLGARPGAAGRTSRPDMPGISTSSVITSGLSRRPVSDRLAAVAGRADDLDLGRRAGACRRAACRIRAESSTTRTRTGSRLRVAPPSGLGTGGWRSSSGGCGLQPHRGRPCSAG